jgi:glyoxylate reductase
MLKPRIFISQPIAEAAGERLRKIMDVKMNPDSIRLIPKRKLIEEVAKHDYLFCLLGDIVDAEVIRANPDLKMIASMAIIPAEIDVQEATRRKIPVTVIPPCVGEETADLTWALLLAAARRILEGDRLMRNGVFPGPQSNYLLGSQVHGKTLGIIGMGGIGKGVARRAAGFNMEILYYSRKPHPEIEEEIKCRYVSFEELLRKSDFVSLHPLYTPETRHLIGEKEFSLMKPTAILVNTSRGPVVSQAALIQALEKKKIAGAALDVFEGEPHPNLPPELTAMKNVVLTPHWGSAVSERREAMANVVVDNILALLEGRRPPNLYNPEIYGSP